MKNILKYSLVLLLTLGFVSCSNDDDNGPNQNDVEGTIADFVSNDSDYSSLLAALEKAGLVTVLDGTDEFTVFAPNNAAFDAFLTANGFASINDVPVDLLTNVLLNHVVNGGVESTQLSTGYINSLATFSDTDFNLSLFVNTASGVSINGVSNVTTADINTTNGVIHAVDAVIGLPTIVTQATANNDFSSLVDALVAASDEDFNYVEFFAGTASSPFTVFAPNNDAFADLLATLGVSSVDEISQSTLKKVLNYHLVAPANVRAGDLSEGLEATTFQGENITITLVDGPKIIDATETPANIIATDVQTNNGVIHAIDKVLLPQEVLDIIDPTITRLAQTSGNLSILSQALEITGLDEVLDDRMAEFTVFAPNNAAFEAFLDGADIEDLPVDVLTQVLLNHVLSGTVLSTELETSYTNTLATYGTSSNNLSMYINTEVGVKINGVSNVNTADVLAANGVVHIMSAVIDLPTVVTFATADPTFETLVAALTRADQPDFVGTLSTPNGTSPAPFTVFAPTNDAFEDLFTELGVNDLSEIDGATLTATLNTHVIAEANVRAEDLVDGTVMTLGDDIEIDATNATITDPNGRVSNIIVTNVQAANGVVHAIDKVILPQL
ncbi:MAG: fasciclin domain-containing protein [Flavobacteriaceae bacterium]|nr:fasciclin domain-containing protein [Flavobacteriaceae bacterium]